LRSPSAEEGISLSVTTKTDQVEHQKESEMRNVWRKALVTAGIVVALGIGPGVGLANAQVPAVPLPEVQAPAVPTTVVPPEAWPALVELVDQLDLELPM
jgi:hypothetical protein